MKKLSLPLIACTLSLLLTAGNWPNWRGPASDGRVPDDGEYPAEWNAETNIVWKTPLPGPGNSSPIVWEDKVFLTQSEENGRLRSTICFDRKTGKELWKQTVKYDKDEPTHKTNPHCAASPATDGVLVYVWHGSAGVYAYDLNGKEYWKRDIGEYIHQWGNAASPVIYKETVILHAGPGSAVKLFAFNRRNGETVWEKDLPDAVSADIKEFKGSWATPLIYQNGDRTEMLLPMPQWLTSFNPGTGEEYWRCGGLSDLCYTNAITGDDVIVAMSGFGGPAIGMKMPKPTETGDLTKSHQLWRTPKNPQRIGSGIIVGDYVYIDNAPGIVHCIEARTGEQKWEERMSKPSWSSANLVGDNIYVTDQTAVSYIFKADPEGLQVVSENPLGRGEQTNASMAFSNGQIFLRTSEYLYCIAKQ